MFVKLRLRNSDTCKLATLEQYQQALVDAGFVLSKINNGRVFAVIFFQMLANKATDNKGAPPLGLHILMQQSATNKINNMTTNLTNGYIAPVEIIVKKP